MLISILILKAIDSKQKSNLLSSVYKRLKGIFAYTKKERAPNWRKAATPKLKKSV